MGKERQRRSQMNQGTNDTPPPGDPAVVPDDGAEQESDREDVKNTDERVVDGAEDNQVNIKTDDEKLEQRFKDDAAYVEKVRQEWIKNNPELTAHWSSESDWFRSE